MQAIVFTEYGAPEVLKLQNVALPTPANHEVLVKVRAASINEWDWGLLRGVPFANRMMAGLKQPRKIPILGCDVAGEVEAVGKHVKQFNPGDEVFGDLSSSGWGGFAEYVCADAKALTRKPASMSFEQAAAIPQAGLLAWQGLKKGRLRQGQKVLVNGASGGAGTIALQIAKSFGAEVTAVCRTAKMDFVRSLGADHVVDYTREDFTRNRQTYDLIIDVMAFHSLFDCRRSLKHDGRYVMLGGASSRTMQGILLGPVISLLSSKKMGILILKVNRGLDELVDLFESGKYVPIIDKVFPLSQAAEAFRYYGAGNARGKIVITPEHSD